MNSYRQDSTELEFHLNLQVGQLVHGCWMASCRISSDRLGSLLRLHFSSTLPLGTGRNRGIFPSYPIVSWLDNQARLHPTGQRIMGSLPDPFLSSHLSSPTRGMALLPSIWRIGGTSPPDSRSQILGRTPIPRKGDMLCCAGYWVCFSEKHGFKSSSRQANQARDI